MKSVFAFLLCLCMVLTMIPGNVAFVAKAEESSELVLDANNKGLCPACNEVVTWIAHKGSNRLGSFTDGAHRHYYLSGDVTAQSITSSLFRQANGSNVCLHLNGHDITTGAYIQVDKSVLNIMGTGNVTFTATTPGDAGYRKYGFMISGTVNLLGGNYALAEAALETGIPMIYQSSGQTLLGDVTMSGLADIVKGSLTLSNTASAESIRINTNGQLIVAADWSGKAQADFAAELAGGLVPEANGVAEGAFAGKLTMPNEVQLNATADGRLCVSDFKAGLVLDNNNQALCPACNEVVTWTAHSGSSRFGSFTDGKHRHYYLSGDVTAQSIASSLFRQADGSDVCLHLNGHDITTGGYIQVAKSVLNIMGTGNVTFTATSTGDEGYRKYGFFISGTVNLLGGSYSLAEAALETGIPMIYQTSGQTLLGDVTMSGFADIVKGSLTLSNTASAESLRIDTNGQLIVAADWSGKAQADFVADLAGGLVPEANGVAEGAFTGKLTTANDAGLTATAEGRLYIADFKAGLVLDDNRQAVCPACNEIVTWTAHSGSNRFGSFTDGKHRHYYLSGDVTAQSITSSLFRQANGSNVCLHLNGHDIITGAYIQVDKSVLNIMGTGNVTFTATTPGDAGYRKYGFMISGTVNLLGGNYALAEAALETGIPMLYQSSGQTLLRDVSVSGVNELRGGQVTAADATLNGTFLLNGGTLTLGNGMQFTGSTTDLYQNGGTLTLTSDFTTNRPVTADASASITELCAATEAQSGLFIGAGNRSIAYDGTNIVFTDPTVQLCDSSSTASYGSVWAAMNAMTEGQYVKLLADTTENITVTDTLYLDLNGKTLTGSVTGEGTLFGMDSATDKYTTDTMGRITGTVSCAVEFQFKTSITGKVRRYMAIADDHGYTFHRFYLGITHMNLKPGATGVGYKAVFCGDEQVLLQVTGYGYTLWIGADGKKLSAGKDGAFTSGKTVTARLQNFDVENYGETPIYGQVYVTLLDGTTIESAEYSYTLRSLVEQVAANVTAYGPTQLEALKTMLTQNRQATAHWNIAEILNYQS